MPACSVYGPTGRAGRVRALERRQPAAHEEPVPARAVLVEEQHRLARGPDPRTGARRLQLHQRDEPVHLRLAREQLGQDAPQAQRLLASARAGSAARPRWPQ